MSPISSSTRSSSVTIPAVPPYSSTTMARWARSLRISDRADSTILLMGRNFTGRQTSPTWRESASGRRSSRSRECTKPITSSYDSWYTGNREYRACSARFAACDSGMVAGRNSTSVRGTSTSRTWRLVPGDKVAQLLVGHDPAAGRRVAAEQLNHQVGGLGQQPDQRPGDHGEPVNYRAGYQRHALGALEGKPLGRQLAEDQREEGDHQGHGDHRQRVSDVTGHELAELVPEPV